MKILLATNNPREIVEKKFEIIARAVILQRGKILLCRRKDKDYYFLPGGHVEWGEKTEDALARELAEELGISIRSKKFIGAMENIFLQDGERHHELNLVFRVEVEKIVPESREDHLHFSFVNIDELSRENFLPLLLKKSLVGWLKDKKIFWTSQRQ